MIVKKQGCRHCGKTMKLTKLFDEYGRYVLAYVCECNEITKSEIYRKYMISIVMDRPYKDSTIWK